jgi:hypothetical protein
MRILSSLTSLTFSAAVATVAASLASFCGTGCSPYDPDLGDIPYKCADQEPFCPGGYTCLPQGTERFCVSSGGVGVDSGGGSGSGLNCAEDSTTEGPNMNDDISHAYATPVEQSRNTISFAGLVICPMGDRDTYAITLLTQGSIEAVVTTEGGAPVQVNLLNSGGANLMSGTSNGTMSIRAFVANVPAGQYYAQAFATATAENRYKLTINVTH